MSEGAVPDRGQVLAALNQLRDPKTGRGMADAGLVRGLILRADRAGFMLEVPEADVPLYRALRDEAEAALARATGVRAQVILTAETTARSEAVVIDVAMPTPHTVFPSMEASTYAAAAASSPEDIACSE